MDMDMNTNTHYVYTIIHVFNLIAAVRTQGLSNEMTKLSLYS